MFFFIFFTFWKNATVFEIHDFDPISSFLSDDCVECYIKYVAIILLHVLLRSSKQTVKKQVSNCMSSEWKVLTIAHTLTDKTVNFISDNSALSF